MSDLVLLRHGESTANAAGLFTGAWDVPLSARGRTEAEAAAELMVQAGVHPAVIWTSPLARALQTTQILDELAGWDSRVIVSAELTERGYGALTGLRKDTVGELFGAEQAHRWRRGLTQRPPRAEEFAPEVRRRVQAAVSPAEADNGAAISRSALVAESLHDVITRVRHWHDQALLPTLRTGGTALVVAHGNSLRALVAVLDRMAEVQIERLNIPTGQPLRYEVDATRVPVPGSGTYLDPESAMQGVRAVEREGGT